MASNLVAMAFNLVMISSNLLVAMASMASNLVAIPSTLLVMDSDGLQPSSDLRQPTSDGLLPRRHVFGVFRKWMQKRSQPRKNRLKNACSSLMAIDLAVRPVPFLSEELICFHFVFFLSIMIKLFSFFIVTSLYNIRYKAPFLFRQR